MANFTGDSGDNKLVGTADSDSFQMAGGGEDTVIGNGGDDFIFFDGGLDAGDHIDGGDGINDDIFLDGDYSLVFTDTTLVNVENIVLRSGHSYDLTLAAGTAVDGTLLVQQDGLGVHDHVRIDASLFTAGHNIQVNVGQGGAALIGGAGNDSVNAGDASSGAVVFSGNDGDDTATLGHAFTRADRIDGGDGADTVNLSLAGDYLLNGKMLRNVETLNLIGEGAYGLTMSDANLANGHTLVVDGRGAQSLSFDGSAERNGAYDVFGTAGADSLTGGGGADSLNGGNGDDVLTGGKGADIMQGGIGADSFMFDKLSASGHHKQFDLISDLDASDHIDLSAIDARTDKAGNQAFHIVGALSGHAGELAVSFDAGANLTTVAGDVNGDGRADITFHVTGDATGFAGWVL